MGDHDFNVRAVMLPCSFGGELIIDGVVRSWEIVAGGAGYLYTEGAPDRRFLCKELCCDHVEGVC